VLKLCLQLLVGVSIALRLLALGRHLRRIWLHDGRRSGSAAGPSGAPSLAGEFRRELRRRGLLPALPPTAAVAPPGTRPGDPSASP
jgi:hypothetical protein